MLKTDVVCHALGDTFHEVGVRARSSCKCMDDLAPNGDRKWHLGRTALFSQEGDEDIQCLLDHARQLRVLVGRMDHRPAEELEFKAVEDAYDDRVWVKDDEGCLENEQVLVMTQLAKHEIAAMQQLATYLKAVAGPQSRADLGNHREHYKTKISPSRNQHTVKLTSQREIDQHENSVLHCDSHEQVMHAGNAHATEGLL